MEERKENFKNHIFVPIVFGKGITIFYDVE